MGEQGAVHTYAVQGIVIGGRNERKGRPAAWLTRKRARWTAADKPHCMLDGSRDGAIRRSKATVVCGEGVDGRSVIVVADMSALLTVRMLLHESARPHGQFVTSAQRSRHAHNAARCSVVVNHGTHHSCRIALALLNLLL